MCVQVACQFGAKGYMVATSGEQLDHQVGGYQRLDRNGTVGADSSCEARYDSAARVWA